MKETQQMQDTIHAFKTPQEFQEILSKLQISAPFNMEERIPLNYFEKDLIAFVREQPHDDFHNEFLHIMSSYMTDFLKDTCPASWNHCSPSFWKELIISFFPLLMKITPIKKETENFLSQLKSFVRWLDRRAGTSWYELISKYAEMSHPDLKSCEYLLNYLFSIHFPEIHNQDWDFEKYLEMEDASSAEYDPTIISLFQIKNTGGGLVVLTDLESNDDYTITGLSTKLTKPGILLIGGIHKKENEMFWNWSFTDSVFPQKAKKYITEDI